MPVSGLYRWKQLAERRLAEASEDPRDRRVRKLEEKLKELEGVIGQKTLELDFFAGALRRIEGSRRKKERTGATASTPKSGWGCNRKVD